MNIYVGNISRNTSEEALKQAFEQYGEVTSVKMIKDRITGEFRGFAFVNMPNLESAEQAIAEMNGRDLGGFKLRVNEAREPEARPRTFGNNNRGGFGSGSGTGSSSGNFRRPSFGDKNKSFRSRDRF